MITGAARRIGAEIARTLHAAGCDLLLHYRHSAAEAQALKNELERQRPGSVALVGADLNQPQAPAQLMAALAESYDRLDGLVNNASTFYPTAIASTSLEQWDDLFASNARAPFFLSLAAAPWLARQHGAIVNIVDIYAERPLPGYPIYSMAKAALHMATQALARELGPAVRVNGVAPGNMLWSENAQKAETLDMVTSRTALQRQGEPADIAGMVRFLLLDAPYVTGQVIRVDGGRSTNL